MPTQILFYANDLARHIPWSAVLASGLLSPLLVGVKKWLSIQSEKVMISLVVLFAGLTAAANYLLHVPTADPTIIGIQTAVLAFMTQPIYFFIVKPAIASFRSQVERAAAFNSDIKSAAVPSSGVPTAILHASVGTPSNPVVATGATIQDFNH